MSFPHRAPHEIAAELFESCASQAPGDKIDAARKAAYYLFSELRERLGPNHKRIQELVDGLAINPDNDAARREAQIGVNRARHIFRRHALPPTQAKKNELRNWRLLNCLDRMEDAAGNPRPVMLQLAKRLAIENQSLPLAERRGAGGTDIHALEKLIRDTVKKREKALAAGTWFGPVTQAQAVQYQGAIIRHSGRKKVETFSRKR